MTVSTRDILATSGLLVVPTITLVTIFSWLLYQYQVRPSEHTVIEFNGTLKLLNQDRDAFYIQLSSTVLLAIASAISTIMPLLAGCAVALAAYPVAQGFLTSLPQHDYEKIPTPFQFVLIIKLLRESTYAVLWSLGKYCVSRKRGTKCTTMLNYLATVATISTILSVLVFAADFWLHIATSTVSIPMASALPRVAANYSLSLVPDCSKTNNSYVALRYANTTCNVMPFAGAMQLSDQTLHYETLNNQSSKMTVTQYDQDQSISYLSVSPVAIDPSHDFTAKTLGIKMSCQPISEACNLSFTGPTAFNCSHGAFADKSTDLSRDGFTMQSFQNADMSDKTDLYKVRGINNPFYWAAAFRTPSSTYGIANVTDAGFVYNLGLVSAVLLCNASILDIEYDSVQGQVVRLSTSMASDSTANIFNLVPASQVLGEFGWTNVQTAVQLAAILTNNTGDFVDRFSKALSNTLLSSGVSAVQRAPAVVAQRRIDVLVTKLPKTPFFVMLGTVCAFIIMGVVLTCLALYSSEEARAVQMRLSVAGLVAGLFEGVESRKPVEKMDDMFAEYVGTSQEIKIGVERNAEGGYEFKEHRYGKEERDEVVAIWERTQLHRIEIPKSTSRPARSMVRGGDGYLIQ